MTEESTTTESVTEETPVVEEQTVDDSDAGKWEYGDDDFTRSLKAKYNRGSLNDTKPEAKPKKEINSDSEEVTDEEKAEVKSIKFKVGDQEVEIPEDHELEVKVDKENQKVTLAELKKNWSGKVAYDKKFQELHQEKVKFHDSVKIVDGKLNEVFKELTTGDKELGLRKLFKMAKKEHQYDEVMDQLKKDIEERSTLSEEEIRFREEKRKLKFERDDIEAEKKAKQVEAETSKIEKYAFDLMDKNSVSADEYRNASKAILDNYPKEKLESLTAEQLVNESINIVLVARDEKLMQTVIEKVDSSKAKDQRFFQDIIDVFKASKLEFNEENIEFIARELVGKPTATKDSDSKASPSKDTQGAPSKNNTAKSDSEENELSSLVAQYLY